MGRCWIKRWHAVSATSGRKDVDQKETGSSTGPKRHSNESRDGKTKEKEELAQLRVLEEEMKDRERVPRVQKNRPATDIPALWLGHPPAPPHHGVGGGWLSPASPRAFPRDTRKSEIFAPRTKVLCFLQLHLDNNNIHLTSSLPPLSPISPTYTYCCRVRGFSFQ